MKEDLPAPGTPVMPIRTALPEWGRSLEMSSREASWSLAALLSIRVMALPSRALFPEMTPWTSSSTEGRWGRIILMLLMRKGYGVFI